MEARVVKSSTVMETETMRVESWMEEESLSSEGESCLEEDLIVGEPPPSRTMVCKKPVVRFSKAQKACLESFYQQGMTSTAKRHSSLISLAAKDTQLSADQVKVHY